MTQPLLFRSTLIAALSATALFLAAPVGAQDGPDRQERVEQFNKRFTEADANADGKLSRDEAKSKMPMIYQRFEQIDVDKKGFLTKRDIAKALRKAAEARGASAAAT